MNLALNARDAMPRGGKIVVRTENVELTADRLSDRPDMKPGLYVMLVLSDTGYGMDGETLSHVFEPFFTTKAKGKGTGLGLSTVYGIIKQYCGDIQAESALNRGTSFYICLPRAGPETAAPVMKTDVTAPQRGTETILLVEDESGVRNLLKYILTRQGYTVLEAADGVEALERYRQHGGRVHLLLTDMVMPRMGGNELSQHLLAADPAIKVLCMSGYTDDVLVRNGALGPEMSFLQKPLRPEVLASKIREILDGHAVSRKA